jgi:hypothetical protein
MLRRLPQRHTHVDYIEPFLQQRPQIERKRDVTPVQPALRKINIAAALGQL